MVIEQNCIIYPMIAQQRNTSALLINANLSKCATGFNFGRSDYMCPRANRFKNMHKCTCKLMLHGNSHSASCTLEMKIALCSIFGGKIYKYPLETCYIFQV